MNKALMRRSASAALWLLGCCYAAAATEVRGAEPVGFRLTASRLVVVAVRVDGAGPFDFLLDTGTNTTLVSEALAARLGLRAAGVLTLLTPVGERAAPRARLGEVAVAGRAVRDVEALVCGLEELRAVDGRIEGVLGQNFLSRFNYTLDYGARRLEFEAGAPLRTAGGGERVPFESRDGRLLVAAAGGAARASWWLVLDTAATALVLFREATGAVASGPREFMTARTNVGSRTVRVGWLRRLRVGGQEFEGLPVALLPDPAGAAERDEDGLLPTSLFRSIYFNHQEGYVVLKK